MKKIIALILASFMAISLAGCSSSSNGNIETESKEVSASIDAPETITITSLNGNNEKVQLEVPYSPERIAILDMASLDILDNLKLGDRVVGMASTTIDYLSTYSNNSEIQNLGTIKEADLESVMACSPDVIFIGRRLAASYDALSEIAPVVYLGIDNEIGLFESVKENARSIASMFGMEEMVSNLIADFQIRLDALSKISKNKTALVGMVTSGGYNLLGNDGRCSIIGRELGFENLAADNTTSTHGNESSFETIVQLNPDYVFVLDRDAAVATEGAKLAQQVMENQLVMETDAYKNGNIVYLENPIVWYTAEGGIQAFDIMLSDLESALIK